MVEAKSIPLLQGMSPFNPLFSFGSPDLTNKSRFHRPGKHKTLTRVLSPFDDSVDKNPVVRSVVLKLLLKYR